ncbi:MAG: hypothetical protein IJ493_11500 [Clostridia bacterium]|nr:hypothetical protein [Clostridia bacterium]
MITTTENAAVPNQRTKKKETLTKKMGIGSFIATVIFLFNPCINIIDVLPDFFGYLFLLHALSTWADLCPGIADAVQGLGKLRWFMLLKMFAMILVPLNDDTAVLVLTFGFLIIEAIYLYPAIGRIFDGFEYFATRYNGRAVYKNYKNVRTLTYAFYVCKSVFTLLPELCSLSSFDYSGYVTSGVQIDYGNYKSALVIVGVFLTTLLGIAWLINIIPYIRRIGRETDFLEKVARDYDRTVTDNVGLVFRRALRLVITLIIASFAFFPNLWLDEINVIPTFVGAIFLIAAMKKLSRFSTGTRPAVIASVIFAAVSFVSYVASLLFSGFYGLSSIEYKYEAYELFNLTRVLSIIEYVAMAVCLWLVFAELRKLIKMHLGPDPDITDRRLTAIYADQQYEADRSIIAGLIGAVIMLLTNIVYLILRADIVRDYWLLPFIVTGIWFIYMISTLNQLYDQIEYKYM